MLITANQSSSMITNDEDDLVIPKYVDYQKTDYKMSMNLQKADWRYLAIEWFDQQATPIGVKD